MSEPSASTQAISRFQHKQRETPLAESILNSFKAHRVPIICTIVAILILTTLHHYFLPLYTAKAIMIVQRAQNSPLQAMMGKMTGHAGMSGSRNEYLEKYRNYLNSHEFFLAAARHFPQKEIRKNAEQSNDRSILRTTLSKLSNNIRSWFYVKPTDPSANANEIQALAYELSAGTRFAKSSLDNLIVTVKSRHYEDAVKRANFLADTAVRILTNAELKELNDAKKFIESERQAALTRIKKIDSSIIEFRTNSHLIRSDAQGRETIERVSSLRKNLEVNELKLQHNTRLVGLLSSELHRQEKKILSEGAKSLQSSALINQLRNQIQTLRYKKMLFQAQGLKPESQQVQQVNKKIDQIAARIKLQIQSSGGTEEDAASLLVGDRGSLVSKISHLKRENQYLSSSIETLTQALNKATQSLASLPEAQQTILGFNRSTQLEFSLLKEMAKKTLEIELERVALDSKIGVLEKATIAGIPARYNVLPKLIFATILGFLFCTAIAYALDELSQTIKNRHELRDFGLIAIGNIPRVKEGSNWALPFLPKKKQVDILKSWKSEEEAAEVLAIKHIRAMVTRMRQPNGKPAQTICILGATAGDGKSFVSANIGISLAQSGKKTLLLDADLRRPTLATRLGIPKKIGFTTVLTGKGSFEECVTPNLMPNLDVLSSGPHEKRPTELLNSKEFKETINKVKEEYDYVVIDTPPLLPIVDGLTLAANADASIFAISHRKTKLNDIQQAIEKLQQFDDRPLFAVYNRVESSSQYSYIYAAPQMEQTTPLATKGKTLQEELAAFKRMRRQKEVT